MLPSKINAPRATEIHTPKISEIGTTTKTQKAIISKNFSILLLQKVQLNKKREEPQLLPSFLGLIVDRQHANQVIYNPVR